MSFPQEILWFTIFLVALYFLFVAYKLWHEIRYRRKPYIALSELIYQHQNLEKLGPPLHELFLLGDFGNLSPEGNDAVQLSLLNLLPTLPPESSLALLGDNVYPVGLPPEGARHRQLAEKRFNRQVTLFSHFKGRLLYLSGNHDWNKGRPGGYAQLLRQEEYITNLLGSVFLPEKGCPGPVLVDVHDQIALVVINTQWWVHRGDRPIGKAFACSVETEEEFFSGFQKLLEENQHRHVVVLAHHPLYSNALHGGKHAFKHHVFPLTAAHKRLYIPVPVAGSLYPLYRRFFGAAEDMAHPRYRKLRKRLLRIIKQFRNVVYAAGHDHNLQHFRRKGNHFLISGSGSKTAFVRRGGKASFTHEHLGFFSVSYYANGQVWLRALEPDLSRQDGSLHVAYQTCLYQLAGKSGIK